eukprot:TRINITY_DN7007_c0_g1_i2.p1 TRINITY_DN7007_c0_g1~~TRINITY_DN7007_c0_g1_i2.p1  ORF type:complete len:433 (-),score=77.64 TRINITY_DN7007_c0_g1_i2:157-1455(-)
MLRISFLQRYFSISKHSLFSSTSVTQRIAPLNSFHCCYSEKSILKDDKDTIYALSTAPGKSGVAVIRISGSEAKQVLDRMCRFVMEPERDKLTQTSIVHPKTRELLDKGMAVWFKGPRSYTGEDTVEFHLHGSPAVVRNTLEAIQSINRNIFRPALAGEFTRRAYENGKIDLIQAEALSDLLESETESQRRLALSQLSGNLSSLYQYWTTQLKHSLAHVEAMIDFAEDQEIESEVYDAAVKNVEDLKNNISNHLHDNHRGEIIRSGIRMAIFGPPNAGKSTLLNALAKRPVAITSPIAGTTRDILEVSLNVDGFAVVVSDTAGLRETNDPIEQEGVKRAKACLQKADIKLLLLEPSEKWRLEQDYMQFVDADTFVVVNKSDLLNQAISDANLELQSQFRQGTSIGGIHFISCEKDEGIPQLLSSISQKVRSR